MNNNLLVIIPCAGIGNRFSSQIEKQHASLGDLSVIETTLDTFMMFKPASKIVVVVKDPESFQKKISIKLDERFSIVSGGNSRSESVLNGIRSENIEKYDYVMTHDGVRPYIDLDSLEKIYTSILDSDYDCIFYGIRPKDSIKRLEGGSCKVEERDNFILVQTPQICESKKLKNALEVQTSENIYLTDESSALENSGYSVNFIEGSQKNIKITFQEDLVKEDILIGNGFDLHRFCEGNSIVFGGVKFPFEFGIEAISDGDVILHSIIDALLGAMRKKDIGTFFPDNKNRFKNIRSPKMLKPIIEILYKNNFYINNLDINLICEQPKVSKYRTKIINALSKLLNLDKDLINLKGKTVEKLGLIGKEKAIACEVICSISQ